MMTGGVVALAALALPAWAQEPKSPAPPSRPVIAPDVEEFWFQLQDPSSSALLRDLQARAKSLADQAKGENDASRRQSLEEKARALEAAAKALQDSTEARRSALEKARQALREAPAARATRNAWIAPFAQYAAGRQAITALTPELARKTTTIMALRRIQQLGLTTKDIQAALPVLKDLQAAQKSLESETSSALDDERRALLAAKPGAALPASSSEKLQKATETYREKQRSSWEALGKAIGNEKANGLRGLISDGGGTSIWSVYGTENGAAGALARAYSAAPSVAETLKVDPLPRGAADGLFRSQRVLRGPGAGTTIYLSGGSLTLTELIDLLTQKMQAMREE
jgi:hypothetical protein